MVTVLSVEDMKCVDMGGSKGGKIKYPWFDLKVDEAFPISLAEMRKTDYRPTAPTSLLKKGWKFITRKTAVDGIMCIVVQRVA